MDRVNLSNKFMRGSGLEIGALHFPWPIGNEAKVTYIDRFSREELIAQYPEHSNKNLCRVDIIDDGFVLAKIGSEQYDFLCASHALEHAENFIPTLFNWLRVIRSGGYLFIAIPERTSSFDKNRENTTWEHHLSELDEVVLLKNREPHYREYFTKVDNMQGEALESQVALAMSRNDHIHFHCWDKQKSIEIFDKFVETFGGCRIMSMDFEYHEMLIVIRKD